MQLLAVDTGTAASSRGATKGGVVVTRDGTLDTTRVDVDSSLVRGVPVTSNGGLVGERQAGLGIVDLLGLVGVLVDDGLIEDSMISNVSYRGPVARCETGLPSSERDRTRKGCYPRAGQRRETRPCADPGE